MPKYRVVTPKGASFTVAGSDYSYEREALDPIDAEIIEAPANEAGVHRRRQGRRRHLRQGHPDHASRSSTRWRTAR